VPLIQTCTVEDPLHGVVIVHTDIGKGWIEVAGDGFPAVHLRRGETAEVSSYVPIGTRDPAHLALTVDGTPATLSLGRGRFTRGSFRADAHALATAFGTGAESTLMMLVHTLTGAYGG
jgi:hypothetical protein